MNPLIFESCHSTWFFDTERMQFCRVLKMPEVGHRKVRTAWRTYYGLELDPHS